MRAISALADRMKKSLKLNLYLNKRSVTSDESGEKLQATCRFRNNGSSAGSPRVLEPVWFDLRQKINEKEQNYPGRSGRHDVNPLGCLRGKFQQDPGQSKAELDRRGGTVHHRRVQDHGRRFFQPGQPSHGGPLHLGQQCQGEKRPGNQGNRF